MGIRDDARSVLGYYEKMLKSAKQQEQLSELKTGLGHLIQLYESSTITESAYGELKSALTKTAESIWFEIGSRLAQAWDKSSKVEEIFQEQLAARNQQARFNVVALAGYLPIDFASQVLKGALSDKSKKVRTKAADMVLVLHRRDLLEFLSLKLQEETDPDVAESITFTITNFDKLTKGKDGAFRITGGR